MFPYYWNGFIYTEPFEQNITGVVRKDVGLDALPDEVLEALEIHKNQIRTERDRAEFLKRLNMLK